MTSTKRISISFSARDTDIIDFLNCQHNASLAIRFICKQWIAQHGTRDIVDTITNQLASETKTPSKQDTIKKNDNQKLVRVDADLSDDIFDDL